MKVTNVKVYKIEGKEKLRYSYNYFKWCIYGTWS